jgi:hypothetical protein
MWLVWLYGYDCSRYVLYLIVTHCLNKAIGANSGPLPHRIPDLQVHVARSFTVSKAYYELP